MKRTGYYTCFFLFLFCIWNANTVAQKSDAAYWHGKPRKIHYRPEGGNFVLVNGKQRFNRALYGSNTAFRAEAGDLPEFALYLPGMGGNLKFGLIAQDSGKWIIHASSIEARYIPGSMVYTIRDPLLKNGTIRITVLPLFDREGFLVKMDMVNVPEGLQLLAGYGGVTGTRFSREGDIGADPESSFYLKPEYCRNNTYLINGSGFTVYYGARTPTEEELYEIQHKPSNVKDTSRSTPNWKQLSGIFPLTAQLKISDAGSLETPDAFSRSTASGAPALSALMPLQNGPLYFFLQPGGDREKIAYKDLPSLFLQAEAARKKLAERIKLQTPDPYINTLGGALSIAADAIWEDPSYLHGAVAWRMRLNGWRGAYAADALGWHDRARKHFSSYARSQLTSPLTAPVVMDTALNLARAQEKLGTSLFSSGYISRNPNGDFRPHHYDMNLVFVDQLLNHFMWTGDTSYVRSMWPLLTRHLDWEKRNFDADGDGLYDSYAAIWASDALQYSGGGVTHSSSYNYRSNLIASRLARIIGVDGRAYALEAEKILEALNKQLWMPSKGSYAEFKDLLGNRLLHTSPGLWTIYHAIDSKVPDPFQSWQQLKFADANIPRIPIRSAGLNDSTLYTLSTTNWHPYTWSLNNVALSELMHTVLAYWQGGRREDAFKLWKSTLVESMYLGASPGNLQQLSFYDAVRGELYRDFADGIGMTARSLVEGLFGVFPDALMDTLFIKPGFPKEWKHASLSTPDFDLSFLRKGNVDVYRIKQSFPIQMNLLFQVPAERDEVEAVLVNGKKVFWRAVEISIDLPEIMIPARKANEYRIEIKWRGNRIEKPILKQSYHSGERLDLNLKRSSVESIYDPQQVLSHTVHTNKSIKANVVTKEGTKTFFLKTKQGRFTWWSPVSFVTGKPVELLTEKMKGNWNVHVKNNTGEPVNGTVQLNDWTTSISLPANPSSSAVQVPDSILHAGSNRIFFRWKEDTVSGSIINWRLSKHSDFEKVDLTGFFNDKVTNIFQHKYLSPRPKVSTLQLPTQGIGNWAYPLTTASINDSGLRRRAGVKNEIILSAGIPLGTPSKQDADNIVFTSLWDNFPDSVTIPLSGKSSHAYLLLAGTTNPMQSRLTNGVVLVYYSDGSSDSLELKNPENWWPIEQDLFDDGYAFKIGAPKPVRIYLKEGKEDPDFSKFVGIRGYSSRGIDGGAATVLDLPLDGNKKLEKLVLKTIANDVVIGLMSLTLVR